MRVRRQPGRAFTLIELLVVIGIVTLLLGILLPVLGSAREAGRQATCMSALRQWATAVTAYLTDSGDILPREGASGSNNLAGAWYNALPPYVHAPGYGDMYTGTLATTSEYRNEWIWYCPTQIQLNRKNSTSGLNSFHYAMNGALNGVVAPNTFNYPAGSGLVPNDIKWVSAKYFTTPSATVFMTEPFNNSPTVNPRNGTAATGGNIHYDRHQGRNVNVSFFDGHVGTTESGDADAGINVCTYGGVPGQPVYGRTEPGFIWGPFPGFR